MQNFLSATSRVVSYQISGTYTVRVSVSREDAGTPSERRASFFTVSAVIEIADAQETYVEIPVR